MVLHDNSTEGMDSWSKFSQDELPSSTTWKGTEDGEIEFLFTLVRDENRTTSTDIRVGLEIKSRSHLGYEHHAMIHDLTKKLVGDVGRSVARRVSLMAKHKRSKTVHKDKVEVVDKVEKAEGDCFEMKEEEEEEKISIGSTPSSKTRVKSNKVVPL